MTTTTGTLTDSWLRRFKPADAPVRLICFPHAGGAASYYFPVARALSPGVDVVAVQYPGRQDRRGDAMIDSIEGLADAVLPALLPVLDRPFALFGHSLGATLAYEVERRLEERGHTAERVFASGRRAPSTHRDEFTHVSEDRILAELKNLSGTDPSLLEDEEVRRMVLPAIRNDYKAAETYRWTPGPALAAPVTALVGDADDKVALDEARAWEQHTAGGFECKVYPGGHFYLNEQAPAVIGLIRDHLVH